MSEIRYICAGNCKTMITAKEFNEGHKRCMVKDCESFNKGLERAEYCFACNTHFEEGEDHICF